MNVCACAWPSEDLWGQGRTMRVWGVITHEVCYRGVLGCPNECSAVPHVLGTLRGTEPGFSPLPCDLQPLPLPLLYPLHPGAPITWYLACHSCTRFRPSSLIPLWLALLGYSGSGVPLGNMYLRPPPRITWGQIRAGGLWAW